MKKLLLLSMLLPFLAFSQSVNELDASGKKQGIWTKTYKNGNLRYRGQFKDDKPQGLFYYYFSSGESQAEKELLYIFLSNRVYPDAENHKLISMNIRTEVMNVISNACNYSTNPAIVSPSDPD